MQHLADQHFMQRALDLAARGRLSVSPNPMVGCVIVNDGRVIGEGWHQIYGGPHAEVNAINACDSKQLAGATAYVTLEPCCHIGKTGPCTEPLINSGIKRVVVACQDPNPNVNGAGIEQLRQAGILVELGIEAEASQALNRAYFHVQQNQQSYVIAKWAMSLDGQTQVAENDDPALTGHHCQQHCHQLRQQVDAVMIGSETARRDNPNLTVRLADNNAVKQPIRIVICGKRGLPSELNLFNHQAKTWLLCPKNSNNDWHADIVAKGHEIHLFASDNDQIKASSILHFLAERGINSVLLEGGDKLRNYFFQQQCIHECYSYIAPTVVGPWPKKRSLDLLEYKPTEDGMIIHARFTGE